jgi:hypothetical protein
VEYPGYTDECCLTGRFGRHALDPRLRVVQSQNPLCRRRRLDPRRTRTSDRFDAMIIPPRLQSQIDRAKRMDLRSLARRSRAPVFDLSPSNASCGRPRGYVPDNLKLACEMFPESLAELNHFGANFNAMVPPVQHPAHCPVRIASLGSGMHRDWADTDRRRPTMVRIHSPDRFRQDRPRLSAGSPNIEAIAPTTQRDITNLYSWVNVAVVSVKPNLRASGIIVVCEATVCSVPIISSDNGLRAYFRGDEICYEPANDASALCEAIEDLAADDHLCFAMPSADLSSRAHAFRHYSLSREIIDGAAQTLI